MQDAASLEPWGFFVRKVLHPEKGDVNFMASKRALEYEKRLIKFLTILLSKFLIFVHENVVSDAHAPGDAFKIKSK